MSASIHTVREKRKVDQIENAVASHQSQRPRLLATSTTTKSQQSPSAPTFHECHLTMLQSLHQDDGDDDSVDSHIWNQIKLFLDQRHCLQEKREQRDELRGIHRAAIRHVRKQNKACSDQGIFTPQQQAKQIQSPAVGIFSPLGTSPPGQGKAQPRQTLALVARLLGRKTAASQGMTRDQPFSSLLEETETRISNLEDSLRALRRKELEDNRLKMAQLLDMNTRSNPSSHSTSSRGQQQLQFASNENEIAETEKKIRLWSMLAHALFQIE